MRQEGIFFAPQAKFFFLLKKNITSTIKYVAQHINAKLKLNWELHWIGIDVKLFWQLSAQNWTMSNDFWWRSRCATAVLVLVNISSAKITHCSCTGVFSFLGLLFEAYKNGHKIPGFLTSILSTVFYVKLRPRAIEEPHERYVSIKRLFCTSKWLKANCFAWSAH